MAGTVNLTLQPSNGKFSSNPVFNVTGSFGHGNELTITSSRMGFGTKSLSAPAIWDTFQSGNVGDTLQTYNPAWVRYNGPESIGARISNDHARYSGHKSAFNDSANGFSTNWRLLPQTRRLYSSHWAYIETRGQDTGTATSTSPNTLSCSSKSWPTDQWVQYVVKITAGKGVGQGDAQILSNTGNVVTLDTTGTEDGGWWNSATLSSGAAAGVDVPFTVVSGEASVDVKGGGDAFGAWTSTTGVMRIGQVIRVRPTVNGVDAVVKVGTDVQNPILTVTAVQPDATSVFKIVPHCQLKQHRLTATPAAGGTTPINYAGIGTHALSSMHFNYDNTSACQLIPNTSLTPNSVNCPLNGWYRVETWIYLSDIGVPNGYWRTTITNPDGSKSTVTYTNLLNRASDENYLIDEYLIGVMFANVITQSVKAYSSEIYVDSDGESRFEIGNAATYGACTAPPEIQPYTSWSESQVKIRQNSAAISGNKYLYHINSSGVPSPGMLLVGA